MGRVVRRVQCTACAEQGRDNSHNNMAMYEDGGGKCFSCSHVIFKGDSEENTYNNRTEKPMSSTQGLEIYSTLPYRPVHGVPVDICQKYGVKVSVDELTGDIAEVYYPYYSVEGKLVACKIRRLKDKQFRWVGEPKKATLFGQQLLSNNGGQLLQIQEGEKDVLAAAKMYRDNGKNYSVVSIKDGAKDTNKPDAGLAENLDVISKYKTVVLAMDNDKAGQMTQQAAAELLCTSTEVKLLNYPEGIKDAAELNDSGDFKLFFDLLRQTRSYTPEAIFAGSDISLESLLKPLEKGVEIPFKGLQGKLQGLRKGELTTITAAPGAGKSTLSRELSYHLTKQGHRVANIFLEETLEKTAQSLIALDNNVPLPRLRSEPTCISNAAYTKSYNDLIANNRTFFFRHFGSMQSETLMSKMRYFASALQVDYIFLDHLSMVVSGSDEGGDERKLLDMICTNLAKFCTETGVGVIMVVHLRKKGTQDKSASEGGLISLDDLRGSGGIAQLSFNVLAVTRDTTAQEADKANVIQIWVLKNREWGSTGSAGKLVYNTMTGRLQEVLDEY